MRKAPEAHDAAHPLRPPAQAAARPMAADGRRRPAAVRGAARLARATRPSAQHVPPYVIFHDRTLAEIAAREARLAAPRWPRLNGVGEAKLARYGEAVLEVVREN